MNPYLIDQKHAVKNLIKSIYKKENLYAKLNEEYQRVRKELDFLTEEFKQEESSEDMNDQILQHKFNRMAKFSQENNLDEKFIELKKILKKISKTKESINSFSMSLLQISRQGISTVHTTLTNCPDGRSIGSETLKNIIWQGRNQSIHCEEGTFRPPVIECFNNLKNDFGLKFDLTIDPKSNKAKIVVDLLGWNSYENYEKDMISLIG